jgi:uncharacterized delta-60 repeat protein
LEPRRLLAAGALDPTFGDGGEAFIPVPVSPIQTGDVLIQPDGKILIGSISGGEYGNYDALLARLNPDGTLDAAFGDDGVVVIDLANNEQVTGLALQSDGQIIAAGAFGDDFNVVRFTPAGAIDRTFGQDGFASLRPLWGSAGAWCVLVQPDDKIVVGGPTVSAGNSSWDFMVARLNADGSPDDAFGSGGYARVPSPADSDELYSVTLLPDGRIAAAGMMGRDFAVVAFTPDGSVDRTFGTRGDGVVTTSFGGDLGIVDDVKALPDGGLIAAGARVVRRTPTGGGLGDLAMARYRPDGSLDPTFGEGGKVVWDFGPDGLGYAESIAVTPAGKIIVGGNTWDGIRSSGFVAAFGSDGTRDLSFGEGGMFHPQPAALYNTTGEIALQSDGRVIVVGHAASGWDPHTHYVDRIFGPGGPPTLQLDEPTPANPVPWQTVRFHASAADPDPGASLEVAWDFGDGTTVPFRAVSASGSSPSHAYARPGDYAVTATVRDDDGETVTQSMRVKIEPVAVQSAPCDPAQRWLAVGGTAGSDVIRFASQGRSRLRGTLNGRAFGPFSDVARILAFGGPGRDSIAAPSGVLVPAVFDGGAGDDFLDGGGGDDVLLGGDGRDILFGRQGRDTLVGGAGADLLRGGKDATLIQGDATIDVTCAGVTVTASRR